MLDCFHAKKSERETESKGERKERERERERKKERKKQKVRKKRIQVSQTGEFCIIFSCQIPISVFLPLLSQRAHNLLSTVRETTKLHCCSANRLCCLMASLAVKFA